MLWVASFKILEKSSVFVLPFSKEFKSINKVFHELYIFSISYFILFQSIFSLLLFKSMLLGTILIFELLCCCSFLPVLFPEVSIWLSFEEFSTLLLFWFVSCMLSPFVAPCFLDSSIKAFVWELWVSCLISIL